MENNRLLCGVVERKKMAENRYFINDEIVWKVPAETLEEAQNYLAKYMAGNDTYPFDIGLKLEFNETKLTDEYGEEV